MPILDLWAHLEHLHLYKIGNHQNHFTSQVINFIVLLLIVKEYKQIGKIIKYICTVKLTT
jgi:hypothetical protein